MFGILDKAGKNARRADTILNAAETAAKVGRFTKLPRMALSLATSTGYEAALEARHYKENAITQLKEQFRRQNFRDPNELELSEMMESVDKASNSIFALNAVTVGMSNLIMLDNILGRPIGEAIDSYKMSKAAKRIKTTAEGAAETIPLTRFQKILQGVATATGKPITEGLEEGLQKAYEIGGLEHVLAKYNLDAFDEMGILTGVMNEGLGKAFGTQEGLEEVLVGGLLGLFGLPGLGVRGSAADVIAQVRGKDDYTKFLNRLAADFTNNKDTALHNAIASAATMFSVNQERGIAMSLQDFFASKNAQAKSFFEYYYSRDNLGMLDSSINKLIEDIENMSDAEFKENYAKNLDIDVKAAKESIKQNLKDSVDKYKKAKKIASDFADSDILSQDTSDFIKGAASDLFRIFDLDAREEAIAENLNKYGQNVTSRISTLLNKLKSATGGKTSALNNLQRQIDELDNKISDVEVQITEVDEEISKLEEVPADLQEKKDKLVQEQNTYKEQRESVNEEKLEAYREVIENNKELYKEIKGKSISVEDYERNFKDYVKQFDEAIAIEQKISESIKNSKDAYNHETLMRELADLGRISSLRETLLDRWDNLLTPKGQLQFKEELNTSKQSIIDFYKNDIAFNYLVEKIINDRAGIESTDSYPEAINKAISAINAEFEQNKIDEQTATKAEIFTYDLNGLPIKVAIVYYKAGPQRIFFIDNEGNFQTVLDMPDSIFDSKVKSDQFIESLWSTPTLKIESLSKEELIKSINNINNYLKLGITIQDDKVTIGESTYDISDVNSIKKSIDEAINKSDVAIEKDKNTKDTVLRNTLSKIAGLDFNTATLTDVEYTDEVTTVADREVEQQVANATEIAKGIIFNKVKNDIVLMGEDVLPEEIRLAYLQGTPDITFKNYQNQFYRLLGQSNLEQEEETINDENNEEVTNRDDEAKGTDETKPATKEKKRGSKMAGSRADNQKPKEEDDEDDNKPPSGGGIPGGLETGDGGRPVKTGTTTTKTKPNQQQSTASKNTVTKNLNSAVAQFLEIYTGQFGLRTDKEHKDATDAVEQALRNNEFNVEFEVEEYDEKKFNNTSIETNAVNRTAGIWKDGKSYHIYVLLNGVRVGKLLGGNRYLLKNGTPLDFKNDSHAKLYHDKLLEHPDIRQELINAQTALNILNDLVLTRAVNGIVPATPEFLEEAGFLPFDANSFNEFALQDDREVVKLRIEAAKYPNEYSILSNFPIQTYGLTINGKKIIPLYKGGKVIKYLIQDEDGKVKWSKTGLKQVEKAFEKQYKDRTKRKNEQSQVLLVQRADGKFASVDVVSPTITEESQLDKDKEIDRILKGKHSLVYLIGDSFQTTSQSLNVSFTSELADKTVTITNSKYEGEYEIDTNRKSYDVVNMESKTVDDNGKPVLLFTFGRTTFIKNKQRSLELKSKLVRYKAYEKDGKIVILNPFNQEVGTIDSFSTEALINTINQDIAANQEQVLEALSDYSKISKDYLETDANLQIGINATSLKTVAVSNKEANDYIVKMLKGNNAHRTGSPVNYAKLRLGNKVPKPRRKSRLKGEDAGDQAEIDVQQPTTTDNSKGVKVTYTPKGKKKQTYNVVGSKIYNSQGEEVFKQESADRNKIFANKRVKEGSAVVVTYNQKAGRDETGAPVFEEKKYIVNKKGDIMSVQTGQIMKWSEENGDRKAILKIAKQKFKGTKPSVEPITETAATDIKAKAGSEQKTVNDKSSFNKNVGKDKFGGFSIIEYDAFKDLNVDIETLKKEGVVTYTDEQGNECAKAGLTNSSNLGSKWTLVKDLKNMPTHEQGGVDLKFEGGVLVNGIKAENGLLIEPI
jgi:G:T/U-mismatch repair DNA glycosylase